MQTRSAVQSRQNKNGENATIFVTQYSRSCIRALCQLRRPGIRSCAGCWCCCDDHHRGALRASSARGPRGRAYALLQRRRRLQLRRRCAPPAVVGQAERRGRGHLSPGGRGGSRRRPRSSRPVAPRVGAISLLPPSHKGGGNSAQPIATAGQRNLSPTLCLQQFVGAACVAHRRLVRAARCARAAAPRLRSRCAPLPPTLRRALTTIASSRVI